MIEGKPVIYIAILNQGEVRTELAQWTNQLAAHSPYPIIIDYPAQKPISFNRNNIVKKFLANPEADYLMMLDGDIIPPPNILDLVLYQKDIIGGLCFSFSQISLGQTSIVPLILKRNKKKIQGDKFYKYTPLNKKKWTGLTECDAIGTGHIIISRKVLEDPYWIKSGGWFVNQYNKTGDKEIGLDLNFCYRAKKLGYPIFCHTDFKCGHWTPMNLLMIHNTLNYLLEHKEDSEN